VLLLNECLLFLFVVHFVIDPVREFLDIPSYTCICVFIYTYINTYVLVSIYNSVLSVQTLCSTLCLIRLATAVHTFERHQVWAFCVFCVGLRFCLCFEHSHDCGFIWLLPASCTVLLCNRKRTEFANKVATEEHGSTSTSKFERSNTVRPLDHVTAVTG